MTVCSKGQYAVRSVAYANILLRKQHCILTFTAYY